MGRVSLISWGKKVPGNGIVRLNTNRALLKHTWKRDRGIKGRKVERLDRMALERHGLGVDTVYVEASMSADEQLVGIDIDNHAGIGTLAGAICFAEAVKREYMPGLYFEPSTNGKGVHAYIVVKNCGDPNKTRKALRKLQAVLKRFLENGRCRGLWDAEDVEIKGTPAAIIENSRGIATNFRSGTLIKAPRGLIDRADELMATTVVTVDQLLSLKMPAIPRGSAPEATRVIRLRAEKSGSKGGLIFDEERLAGLQEGGVYATLAKLMMGGRRIPVGQDRKVLTEKDLAIFLMEFEALDARMNADGSMPTERWMALWNELYRSGYIDRGWCWERFAKIRDTFSKHQYIEWMGMDYTAKWTTPDRKRIVKGQACRWKMALALKVSLAEYALNLTSQNDAGPTAATGNPTTNLGLRKLSTYGSDVVVLEIATQFDDIPRPRFAGWAIGKPQLAA